MASKIQIVNAALTLFGHRRVASLDAETNETVRIVNAVYDFILDDILEAANWSFARKYAKLILIREVTDTTEPLYGSWLYLYQKPAGCLKVRKVYDQGRIHIPAKDLPKFSEVHDGNVQAITSDLDDAYAEFTERIHDETRFSAAFSRTLAAALAADICLPLTQDATLVKSMQQVYVFRLSEAKRLNSERENDKSNKSGGYLDARK